MDSKIEYKPGLVSVIIPNYNHAQYVGDAIESVLAQTYQNFEIIVVDDGSTDNSRDAVAQFGDKVNYIWQQNQGLSATRNRGIREAKGEFIGVLDADDMYEPAYLDVLVNMLADNPDADGIYCGYQFVDQHNNLLPQRESRLIPTEQLREALWDGNFLVPESMLVRRQCYETVGPFDHTLRACEDWDMWLRITDIFKIIGTNHVLTRHRVLPGSMSSDPIRMFNNRIAVIKKHLGPEPDEYTPPGDKRRRVYGYAYLITAVEYLQYQDPAEAYKFLYQAALYSPTLFTQMSTFYELGCGSQAKGSRGDLMNLDLTHNAETVLGFIERLFGESELPQAFLANRAEVTAVAYYALGTLNYNANRLPQARRYLLAALKNGPANISSGQCAKTIAKSFLPARMVDWVKQY